MGIDADNDLFRQNDRITIDSLRWYGKLLTLLKEIKNVLCCSMALSPLVI